MRPRRKTLRSPTDRPRRTGAVALLQREVVARAVAAHSVVLSAVNYAEVVQKAARHAIAPEAVDTAVERLGLTVPPFGRLDARLAASSYRHRSGLSLGNRVRVALARSLSSPAFTTDRSWQRWADDPGVDVSVIR